jgi:nicotinamide-nucleotide amidase
MDATVLTVGNEIVSGDTENTNASWLSRRLAELGVRVTFVAAVRDDVEEIGGFIRAQRPQTDFMFVTGGLGGTPDDVTREGVAAAFRVPCIEIEPLAGELRARFGPRGLAEYAARWARLPAGAEPLANPLGGAPGFRVENVYVLPGLPSEMREMFDAIAERFRGTPIVARRRKVRATEGQLVALLERATAEHPAVTVGSYPHFGADGPEVEIVLKSADSGALEAASLSLGAALDSLLTVNRDTGDH